MTPIQPGDFIATLRDYVIDRPTRLIHSMAGSQNGTPWVVDRNFACSIRPLSTGGPKALPLGFVLFVWPSNLPSENRTHESATGHQLLQVGATEDDAENAIRRIVDGPEWKTRKHRGIPAAKSVPA